MLSPEVAEAQTCRWSARGRRNQRPHRSQIAGILEQKIHTIINITYTTDYKIKREKNDKLYRYLQQVLFEVLLPEPGWKTDVPARPWCGNYSRFRCVLRFRYVFGCIVFSRVALL